MGVGPVQNLLFLVFASTFIVKQPVKEFSYFAISSISILTKIVNLAIVKPVLAVVKNQVQKVFYVFDLSWAQLGDYRCDPQEQQGAQDVAHKHLHDCRQRCIHVPCRPIKSVGGDRVARSTDDRQGN